MSRGSACACCSISAHAGRDKEGAVEKVKLTRSSGNVFRDLGFSGDEAEYLKVRAELMVNLQKVITARGLKQAQAAKLLGVTQPRVSDLTRGRIDLFSIDTLIDMLARLGIRAQIVLHPRRRRAGAA
jgi:predicted XRE-type DNA-binding protein